MLLELKVKNFAIIDSLHVTFKSGFNILSGETGAGKSVILKSLALLMGEKALADTVRSGAEFATIEGCFDLHSRNDIHDILANMGVEASDDHLIVRRVVSTQGKSRVYLNGSLSALSNLKEVVSPLITLTGQSAPLIEMTGQHDNRHLQSKSYHLDILDRYCGCYDIRQQFKEKLERYRDIRTEIQTLIEQSRTREQRLDFLSYQRDEIRSLDLKPGEENEVMTHFHRIKNSSRLVEFLNQAEGSLYSNDHSVLVRIHQVLQRGQELKQYDEHLFKKLESLAQAKSLIEETVYELRDYGRQLDANPEELNRLEERITALRRVQKKFGGSIEDILSALKDIEEEIDSLESSDETHKALDREANLLSKDLEHLAEDLHNRRLSGAQLLAKGVNEELEDLNMKGVQFHVHISWLKEWSISGASDVEFMIQSSKKDLPRSLAKFASGGELSRILLSLKRVVGHSEMPRTYLFDEVDAGVSGLTAEKVGRKLKSISHGQQVICVTHLPQVASFADHHFYIEKLPTKTGVQMCVKELTKKERINEIARLISGEKISQTSIEHAKQLLQDSH